MPERQARAKPAPERQERRRAGRGNGLIIPNKGERLGGRAPGTPNKVTRTVKDWLLAATEKSGLDGKGKDGAIGYLVWLSRAEPVAYAALLARVMPMQIQASLSGSVEHEHKVQLTADQLAERLKARGLPVPTFIDHDPLEFDTVRRGNLDAEVGDEDE